ncbi:putative metallo-beta-lactamase [Methanothermobacter sp. MT-2]|nr:putative metallo-beta-lactamase [Methanothermobacter sp. MT-2]
MIERIKDIIFIEGSFYDSNSYIIGDVIIDTGTGINKDNLLGALNALNISPDDIKLVINTHCHFDHTGGDKLFPNADIGIHKKDAPPLEEGDDIATAAYLFGASIKPIKVDLKLKEGDSIGDFEIIHTPGHTQGSICLYDGETLISGDTIFAYGGFGRVDMGGSIKDMEQSIKKLLKLDIKYLLPGHGPWTEDGNRHVKLAYDLLF